MKAADLFMVANIGSLDWARIGTKGRYTNICFTIYSAMRKKKVPLKLIRRRLKNVMSIKLGLTLNEAFYMPVLVSELVMIDEKDKISLCRRTRQPDLLVGTHFYSGKSRSKFTDAHFQFFAHLKKILGASHLNCYIDSARPKYVEITATLPRRTFNFPSRFLVNLVVSLNAALRQRSNP